MFKTKEERRLYSRKYYWTHREKSQETARKRYWKNVDRNRANMRRHYWKTKERRKIYKSSPKYKQWCKNYSQKPEVKTKRMDWLFRKRYGISKSQYDEINKLQNGQCAICHNCSGGKSRWGKNKRLTVDHSHLTKKVRGLLCSRCNSALGFLDENVQLITNMILYLQSH